jgi:branched-chain amino acid transport system permease protein
MMTTSNFQRGAVAALALLLLALPLISGSPYILTVVILTLLFGYLALSWNVLGGIAGQLSLGHAAYFGIGAYTSTWLFDRLHLSPWIGMWAGVLLAAVAAVLIGAACFRLRGAYFALATIAASMVLKTLVENADSLLGGSRGMEVKLLRDAPLYFQHTSKEFYFVIIAVLTVIALVVNWAILRSRFGYYLTAIRNDQEAALALGVNTTRYKLLAAVISAAMTAIGGTFYAQFVMYIAPEIVFSVNFSVVIAVICIIGGRGTLWGPLLGALLLHPAEELARYVSDGMIGVDMMLYGLVLMIVIRVQPNGLMAILKNISARRKAARKVQHGIA